jgi:urea transport system permease protein
MASFFDGARVLVIALGVLVTAVAPVLAGPYEDALAGFTSDSFSDTDDAIAGVAASRDGDRGVAGSAAQVQR